MRQVIVIALYSLAGAEDKGATGGNISNVALVKELAQIGSVRLIVPNLSFRLAKELTNIGVDVLSTDPEDGVLRRFAKRAWLARHIRAAVETLDSRSIVVASNGTSDLAFRALYRIRSSRRPQLYLLTRAFEDLHLRRRADSWKALARGIAAHLVTRGTVAHAYRSSDLIITNSEYMASTIRGHFGLPAGKVSILYPPIESGPESWRREPRVARVGFVNPTPRKGVHLFLEVAQRLPNVSFRYFGPEDKRFTVRNVEYGGWAESPHEIYQDLSLLIVPSQWHEPFGRVAVEAIFHGVPALVSNRGGLPETVVSDLVVRDDSVDSWVTAIGGLLSSESKAKSLWQSSLLKAKRFSREAHNLQVRKLFHEQGVGRC